MYTLKVTNPCRCFLKRGMAEVLEFKTKEEVKEEAESTLALMQKEFCKKHNFALSERFGDYTISISPA